jgi:hypothetical protein
MRIKQKSQDSRELITEFHQELLEKYPDITYEEVRDICYAPFTFTRKQMESGECKTVRLKYFGTFRVYPGRAKGLLVRLKDKFEAKLVEPSEYFRIKAMIETYLQDNESKD